MRYILTILFSVLFTVLSAQTDRQSIREGNRLYRQKQYAKAEVQYRKALSKNKENPQALYNLGCALMMQQKDSAAIIEYEHAAKVEQNKLRRAKAYHNMGVICQNHKMYGDAIKAYQQSLRCNPSDNQTRYNLVLCKRQNKEQDQNKDQQQKKKESDQDEKKENENQKKDKNEKQQQQQPQDQMSKENAERLLDAAVQNEKATQQRLKDAMQQPRRKNLQKNW